MQDVFKVSNETTTTSLMSLSLCKKFCFPVVLSFIITFYIDREPDHLSLPMWTFSNQEYEFLPNKTRDFGIFVVHYKFTVQLQCSCKSLFSHKWSLIFLLHVAGKSSKLFQCWGKHRSCFEFPCKNVKSFYSIFDVCLFIFLWSYFKIPWNVVEALSSYPKQTGKFLKT